MCQLFGFQDAAHCPVPPAFFTAVNVPMFWFAAPIAALLSRRHPLVGLAVYGVMLVNVVAHVISGIVAGSIYNPGWLTAIFLFLPLTVWMVHTLFGRGGLRYGAWAFLVAWGGVLHLILAGSVVPLMKGLISTPIPAIVIQVVNAGLLIVVPWLAERWRGGVLIRRVG
ncbi:hypothetical protein GCM10027287_16460 [Bordetella muralis]